MQKQNSGDTSKEPHDDSPVDSNKPVVEHFLPERSKTMTSIELLIIIFTLCAKHNRLGLDSALNKETDVSVEVCV